MLLKDKLGELGYEHVGMLWIDMDTMQTYVVVEHAVPLDGEPLEYGKPYRLEYRWEPLALTDAPNG